MNINIAAWELGKLLDNAFKWVSLNGQRVMLILGLVLLCWAAISLFRNFTAQHNGGPPPVGWIWIIGGLVVGGILLFGGLPMLTDISKGGQDTLVALGQDNNEPAVVTPRAKGGADALGSADLATQARAVITWLQVMAG